MKMHKMMALNMVSGVLLGVGFIAPMVWWCAFFGAALFIFGLQKRSRLRGTLLYAYGFGFVWHLIALAPVFFSVFPFEWFGLESITLQVILITASWVFASAVFALSALVFGILYWFLRNSAQGLHALYILPLAWVVSEWAGMVLFGIVLAGPNSLIGAYMGAMSLGYLVANDLVLLQLAAIGGQYLLSSIIIFGGVGLALAWGYRGQILLHKTKALATVSVFILFSVAAHFSVVFLSERGVSQDEISVSVSALSRYLPPHATFEEGEAEVIATELHRLVLSQGQSEVILLPENSAYIRDAASFGLERPLDNIVIGSSDLSNEKGKVYSEAVFWYSGRELYSYKQLLMPIGEYIPYVYRGVLRAVGAEDLLNQIARVRSYEPGPVDSAVSLNGMILGVRFCDEIFSAALFREHTNAGAEVLFNLSSQSWFHGSPIVYGQLQRAAQVRAVENRRYLAQSGNMTPAFIVNPWGRVIAESEWGVVGAARAEVTLKNERSIFSFLGDWIVLGAALVLIGVYVGKRIRPAELNRRA